MILRRSVSRSALVALALATSYAAAPLLDVPLIARAQAQTSDFVVTDHEIEIDDDTTVSFARIEVKGSSLSKDDFLKMIDADTKKDDSIALLKRFSAASVVIPLIEVEAEKGIGAISGLSLNGIKEGRIAQGSWQSVSIESTDDSPSTKGAKGSIGPMTLANVSFAMLLNKGQSGATPAAAGKTSMQIRDIKVSFPEQTKDKKTAGAMLSVSIASVWGDGMLDDAGLPVDSTGGLRNFVFEPPAGSDVGKALADVGYPKIDAGFEATMKYDPVTQKLTIPNYTASGVGMGALTLMTELGSIDKFAFIGDERERLRALTKGDLISAGLKFVNQGGFEKAVAVMAQRSGKTPEAVKQEWSGMVGQMLPIVLGGDSGAVQMAAEIQKFIAAPQNLSVTLATKNGPIPFMELQGVKDPMALLQRITFGAKANQ